MGPWILIKQSLLSPGVLLPTLIQIDVVSNVSQQKELRNGNELIWGTLWWHLNSTRPPRKPQPLQMRMCGCTWQPVMGLPHQRYSVPLFLCPVSPCPSPLQPHHKYLMFFEHEGCSPYYNQTNKPASMHHSRALLTPKGYKRVLK